MKNPFRKQTITPGQTVRITRLTHDDGSCAHFIGLTGTVTGVNGNTLSVIGLVEPATKPIGFLIEEVEPV